jgi:hypothetical protein
MRARPVPPRCAKTPGSAHGAGTARWSLADRSASWRCGLPALSNSSVRTAPLAAHDDWLWHLLLHLHLLLAAQRSADTGIVTRHPGPEGRDAIGCPILRMRSQFSATKTAGVYAAALLVEKHCSVRPLSCAVHKSSSRRELLRSEPAPSHMSSPLPSRVKRAHNSIFAALEASNHSFYTPCRFPTPTILVPTRCTARATIRLSTSTATRRANSKALEGDGVRATLMPAKPEQSCRNGVSASSGTWSGKSNMQNELGFSIRHCC